MPVYSDMLQNYIVGDRAKSAVITTSGNARMRATIITVALTDASKLPPYMILNCKTKPNNHLKELLTDTNLKAG